jgi:hypothetical protein
MTHRELGGGRVQIRDRAHRLSDPLSQHGHALLVVDHLIANLGQQQLQHHPRGGHRRLEIPRRG